MSPNIINDLSDDDVEAILADTSLSRDAAVAHEVAKLTSGQKRVMHDTAVCILRGQIRATHRAMKIASFSRRISSELLWAHYADSYRGLAYHFVTSGDPNSVFHHLKPVHYTSQRPIVAMTEILETAGRGRLNARRALMLKSTHESFFLHKSPEWAYEEEMRVALTGRKEERFLPEELASIIVDPYLPDESLFRLRAIIGSRSRRLRIRRAEISKTDYSVSVLWDHDIG